MKHNLEFINPVFTKGVNVTVRKGDKWSNRVKEGEVINIARTGDTTPLLTATVLSVNTMSLNEIPNHLLEFEHDPSCRTFLGLLVEMRKVYGYENISIDELVTVIEFSV